MLELKKFDAKVTMNEYGFVTSKEYNLDKIVKVAFPSGKANEYELENEVSKMYAWFLKANVVDAMVDFSKALEYPNFGSIVESELDIDDIARYNELLEKWELVKDFDNKKPVVSKYAEIIALYHVGYSSHCNLFNDMISDFESLKKSSVSHIDKVFISFDKVEKYEDLKDDCKPSKTFFNNYRNCKNKVNSFCKDISSIGLRDITFNHIQMVDALENIPRSKKDSKGNEVGMLSGKNYIIDMQKVLLPILAKKYGFGK